MARLPLSQNLLMLRSPSVRAGLLREAGFDAFRSPRIIADIDAGIPLSLTPREIEHLLPALLRQLSIDDATFAGLAAEAGIVLRLDSAPRDVVVSVPFVSANRTHQLPITELAASSMVMWEISLRVKDVLGGTV